MRSSFFEYHVAVSGLFTAKAGLGVTGHNIANSEIKGYSRQYLMASASTPMSTYNHKGMVGTGSQVNGVGQIRSFYLDQKFWSNSGTAGEYGTKVQQLSLMEVIFNELSDTGLNDMFSGFFKSIQDLSGSASESVYKGGVVSSTQTLLTSLQTVANELRKQQLSINNEIKTVVATINNLGEQISQLNEKIYKYEMFGDNANDLRDQRALLVDELSNYVNVDVTESADGKYSVMLNGYEFVNHYDVLKLECVARDPGDERSDMDAAGLYDIYFSTGLKFNLYSTSLSGQLKGLIDVRDGNNGADSPNPSLYTQSHMYKGIPYYLEQLNVLLRSFAVAINQGTTLNGDNIPDVIGHANGDTGDPLLPGYDFLTYDDPGSPWPLAMSLADYDNMNVFNIIINPDIVDDVTKLLCSSDLTLGPSHNDIIRGIASLENYASLVNNGTINDFVTAIAAQLGIDVKEAEYFELNYTEIGKVVDNQRLQVSGVSLDEEVVSMVAWQHQYQAASKLMSVINDLYDKLINEMGV